MKRLIDEIYSGKKMIGKSGTYHEIDTTSISRLEGEFIQSLILNNPTMNKTLEIGCAWGLSSLFICLAINDRDFAHHTIIDPFQESQWDNVGVNNLINAGFSNFQLIQEKSEIALPNLLAICEAEYDFVLIDGWHTFDHTLLDLFYAIKLIRLGGIVVIDDLTMPSVRQAVDYILQFDNLVVLGEVKNISGTRSRSLRLSRLFNNPFFRMGLTKRITKKILKSRYYYFIYSNEQSTMIAIQKIADDKREWNWHGDLF
jgi:predicted O-methyltransferase YrrM